MPTCSYCEDSETEYTCPECGDPTCEDCFILMTQFNAGHELPCKACDDKHERANERESAREYERDKAAWEEKDRRSAQARARRNTPEARAKRAEAKEARREAKAARARDRRVVLVRTLHQLR